MQSLNQLTEGVKKNLEKQQYRIISNHSAVKTCGWTKNMIRGKGGCYKLKFYGIMSNQCMQATTSISCANRCKFCWRGYKAPVSKDWKWGVDEPQEIFDGLIKEHHKLLAGFKGSKTASQTSYQKSKTVKHVALSLTGEPIAYPRINELLDIFNKNDISTFIVTNAQYPEAIRNLNPITQLYASMDAPNKELLKDIDVPLFEDYWKRFLDSLKELSKKKQRTCVRLTMVKGINMISPEGYAELIKIANPDFIEVKAYMHVGESQMRLSRNNMPSHTEVLFFTQELMKYLPDHELVSEHIPSFVVMAAKKKFKKNNEWHTWIDFQKFNKLVLSKKDFTTEDYLIKTPKLLVGIGTIPNKEITLESLKKVEDKKAPNISEEMLLDEGDNEQKDIKKKTSSKDLIQIED